MPQVGQQVDNPGLREPLDRYPGAEPFEVLTGLAIDRVQEEAGGDDVDDQTTIDIAVRHPFAVAGAHRLLPPHRVRLAVGPELLAARRVDRQDRATIAGRGVKHAVDIARRGLEGVVGVRTEVVSAKHPGHLEVAEVARIDLVERRETGAPRVTALVPPLPVLGARFLGTHARDRQQRCQNQGHAQHAGGPSTTLHVCSHLFLRAWDVRQRRRNTALIIAPTKYLSIQPDPKNQRPSAAASTASSARAPSNRFTMP